MWPTGQSVLTPDPDHELWALILLKVEEPVKIQTWAKFYDLKQLQNRGEQVAGMALGTGLPHPLEFRPWDLLSWVGLVKGV